MHMHTLWIIYDVWHAMIFFLNLDDNAFMDAWMRGCMGEFCFIKKRWITHVCMTWYDVWIFLLHFFFENNIRIDSHFIVISNSWSHSTLILFFTFLNHFLGLINLLTNYFFNHFFETLFEWHAWNCQGLEKVWMRWWRLTRELSQFELVLGHKMCLGFPQLLMVWRKWWGLQKLPRVWEPRMVLGCKSVFDFSQMRRLKNDGVFTSCSWCDHNLQCK